MKAKKKVVHSAIKRLRRGEKPVQAWFTQVEWERLLHAATIARRSLAALVQVAALRAAARIIEYDKREPGLFETDERS